MSFDHNKFKKKLGDRFCKKKQYQLQKDVEHFCMNNKGYWPAINSNGKFCCMKKVLTDYEILSRFKMLPKEIRKDPITIDFLKRLVYLHRKLRYIKKKKKVHEPKKINKMLKKHFKKRKLTSLFDYNLSKNNDNYSNKNPTDLEKSMFADYEIKENVPEPEIEDEQLISIPSIIKGRKGQCRNKLNPISGNCKNGDKLGLTTTGNLCCFKPNSKLLQEKIIGERLNKIENIEKRHKVKDFLNKKNINYAHKSSEHQPINEISPTEINGIVDIKNKIDTIKNKKIVAFVKDLKEKLSSIHQDQKEQENISEISDENLVNDAIEMVNNEYSDSLSDNNLDVNRDFKLDLFEKVKKFREEADKWNWEPNIPIRKSEEERIKNANEMVNKEYSNPLKSDIKVSLNELELLDDMLNKQRRRDNFKYRQEAKKWKWKPNSPVHHPDSILDSLDVNEIVDQEEESLASDADTTPFDPNDMLSPSEGESSLDGKPPWELELIQEMLEKQEDMLNRQRRREKFKHIRQEMLERKKKEDMIDKHNQLLEEQNDVDDVESNSSSKIKSNIDDLSSFNDESDDELVPISDIPLDVEIKIEENPIINVIDELKVIKKVKKIPVKEISTEEDYKIYSPPPPKDMGYVDYLKDVNEAMYDGKNRLLLAEADDTNAYDYNNYLEVPDYYKSQNDLDIEMENDRKLYGIDKQDNDLELLLKEADKIQADNAFKHSDEIEDAFIVAHENLLQNKDSMIVENSVNYFYNRKIPTSMGSNHYGIESSALSINEPYDDLKEIVSGYNRENIII